ncbi:TolB family protein [Nocardioides sp. GXQ0305]|uniref:TolB family protein n=1 Tax=Nocardioides sp. GXQ0305 TaxID=3423912 RepID=UPI003D7EB3E6
MNTEQLTRLAARADQVTGHGHDRLGEVHDRIRARRRRRAAGAVVGAGMLVLAVVGGTVAVRAGLDDPAVEPAGPTPDVRNGALVSLSDNGLDVVEVEGDVAHLPDDGVPFTRLQFTADGSELVYVAFDRQVTALDVATGSSRVLTTCPGDCLPSLAPDGRTVAMEGEEGLVLQDVEGGPAVPLGVRGSSPTWSPDGERIAYLDRRGLMVVGRDGGGAQRLATYDVRTLHPPAWSPDGTWLVFVIAEKRSEYEGMPIYDHTLATVGLDGAPPVRLADLGHCVCLGVSAPTATWSPDGELLAYTRIDPGPPRDPGAARAAGVHVMRPGGTGAEPVGDGEAILAWQPVPRE